MKISTLQKRKIKTLFEKMNSKDDFLELLNVSKETLYKNKSIPFSLKQLNYYLVKNSKKTACNLIRSHYNKFEISKKSGGKRSIHAPEKGLKEFQKALNLILQSVHAPNKRATGFIQGKSIIDNASCHIGKNYVYNIDLKDFFPSIEASRVWGRLLIKPFNLGTSEERKRIANMIKTLCCTELEVERLIEGKWKTQRKHVLPQGAPTSPTLTNAICDRLDRRLVGVAKRFGLSYSRYADDITFSSDHNTYKNSNGEIESIYGNNDFMKLSNYIELKMLTSFQKELIRIVKDQKFHIKESKIRLQKRGYKQEVTGLIVNDKINASRKYVKNIRQAIYFWERYGLKKAEQLFFKNYIKSKVNKSKGKPKLTMVIEGKLLYLKMIKGADSPIYLKLKERFDSLVRNEVNITPHKKKSLSQNLKVLSTLFEGGYENALKKFIK